MPKGHRPALRARLLRERRRVAGHVAERPGGLLLDARVELLQAGGQAGQRARARHRARQLGAVLGDRAQAARGRALLVPALRAQRRRLRPGGARPESGRDTRWACGRAECAPASCVRQASRLWSLRRRQCTNTRCMTRKLLACPCKATHSSVGSEAHAVPRTPGHTARAQSQPPVGALIQPQGIGIQARKTKLFTKAHQVRQDAQAHNLGRQVVAVARQAPDAARRRQLHTARPRLRSPAASPCSAWPQAHTSRSPSGASGGECARPWPGLQLGAGGRHGARQHMGSLPGYGSTGPCVLSSSGRRAPAAALT
jgi:hypothetical protein